MGAVMSMDGISFSSSCGDGRVVKSNVRQVRIPLELDQRFRRDPNTDSGRTRSLIPTDPITRSGGPDR
jgi:hypothetical protein